MSGEKRQTNIKDYREMLVLKGLASELEKMAYPRIDNLRNALSTIGYDVVAIQRNNIPVDPTENTGLGNY